MSITGIIITERQGSDHRSSARLLLQLSTRGVTADGDTDTVLIHNLSATGLLIETQLDLPLGQKLWVELPEIGKVSAAVVWESDGLAGCRFDEPFAQQALIEEQPRIPIQHGSDCDDLATADNLWDR